MDMEFGAARNMLFTPGILLLDLCVVYATALSVGRRLLRGGGAQIAIIWQFKIQQPQLNGAGGALKNFAMLAAAENADGPAL
jgi:hypothetical protein